jgi:hypothetical protein
MICALPALMLALSAAPADAQDPAPAAAAVAPAPAPAGMINGNAPFLVGGVSNQPYFFGGLALNGGVIVALGLGLSYDGSLAKDQTSFFAVLHAEYMAVNKANYAFGPELTVILPFAPTAFNAVTLAPGFAFWYAPFSAPVLIGAALDLNMVITTTPSSAFSLGTVTPALRLAYVF